MAEIILILIVLIMSAVVHEVSHGLAAYWLGDPTAKYMGRLTLNPLRHLDPWGSFLMPLLFLFFTGGRFFFASAKPVPYNPYNLRNQRTGPALVGVAGPAANILIALVFGICLKLFIFFGVASLGDSQKVLSSFFTGGGFLGVGAGAIPVIFVVIIFINVLLAFFNLIPFPPLDGSKLLFALLPVREETKLYLEQFGLFFLIPFIILFSGLISFVLINIQFLFFRVVVGI